MLAFKNNIKHVMEWDDTQFDSFLLNWEKAHEIHILSTRAAFMYKKEYFDFLLPLYFVLVQIDVTGRNIVDKKAILIALLVFYLVSDTIMTRQTQDSLETLLPFLTSLVHLNVLSVETARSVFLLLSHFSDDQSELDSVVSSDLSLLRDLLVSSNPVIVSRHHAMFYFDDPTSAVFLVKRPYPKPVDFFDEMFKTSQTISHAFLRDLYSDRLHRLMDAQCKKSIFPF